MKYFIALFIILLISCNRWKPYTGNSFRDKKYRKVIKTAYYDSIPEDKIPLTCGLVRDSSEDLINRKTHIVIGKQWYDFKDGSSPGIYYIIMPTKWELKRYENEKKYLLRRYNMKNITSEEFKKMQQDTSFIIIY